MWGGGNLLDKIPHSIERYGNDSNEYLIEMWKAVSNGWIPPKIITEKELSRLNFKADIYENELEELYEEGYDPYEAAEKYYDDWNHE